MTGRNPLQQLSRNANMSGRMTLGSLFVLAALVPGLSLAQTGGYGPSGGPPGGYPPLVTSPAGPQGSGYPMYPLPPQGGSGQSIYEVLPDDPGFAYEDSPLENALKDLFRHAYFRGEYLLWSSSRPGDGVMGGTPKAGYLPTYETGAGTVPGSPPYSFTTTDPITQNPAIAITPSLGAFSLNNQNGYRGTFGFLLGSGTFEASSFIMQNTTNTFDGTSLIQNPATVIPPAIQPPSVFIGQPVTIAGAETDMLYNQSFQAVMKTGIWGTEANYIFAASNAGAGDLITIGPLVGIRYLNYRETLQEGGGYQIPNPAVNPTTPTVNLNRSTYASSNNNYYGPQFGLRTEANIGRVTLGAEPKMMFGVNSYVATLNTLNVPTDNVGANTSASFYKKATTFGPVADLKLYSRIAVSQYVNVFVAYNLIWAGTLSRPYNNISYNAATPTGLFAPQFTDTLIHGLSVGGEIRY
jgi:Putative beta barrel porin-7 (BBP7)